MTIINKIHRSGEDELSSSFPSPSLSPSLSLPTSSFLLLLLFLIFLVKAGKKESMRVFQFSAEKQFLTRLFNVEVSPGQKDHCLTQTTGA